MTGGLARRLPRALCTGYSVLVFVFLIGPLFIIVPISFTSSGYLQFPPPGFSLRWYRVLLEDPAWVQSAVRSAQVGLMATAMSLGLGLPLSFALVRGRFRGKAMVDRLVMLPIILPTIIYAVAVYGLFSWMRLIGQLWAIAIGHTVHAIPFVVIILTAALRNFDLSQEDAAMGLGASRMQAIRRITLPQIFPSVVTATFLAFISSFDELVIAMFLGGVNMTLPKKLFDNILTSIDPSVAAVSVLQIALVSIVLLIVTVFGSGARPPQ